MELVEEIYRLTRLLPKQEQYVLTDQLRRAVVSIPSNIAEGHGRNSLKEYLHFLNIARGSKNETETQLLILVRLHYVKETDIEKAMAYCDEIGKMLNTLINKLTLTPNT